MRTGDWADLAAAMGAELGCNVAPLPAAETHGGCISRTYRWESSGGPLFVKVGQVADLGAFSAEAEGLVELGKASAVRVPLVLGQGAAGASAFLILEWIELQPLTARSQALLGERLASLHRVSSSTFGWHRDNTIGATPQPNAPSRDWIEFLRERRLRFQFDLARHNGYGNELQARAERLLDLLGAFFKSYQPVPSLLHGDLWGGNVAADLEGQPVIFDPAVYYGDREADIAMTSLFGGFDAPFYTAYERSWPLDAGARTRRDLYNLYHLLNHLNLFGMGYAGQVRSTIDRLLAALGH